ncbi:SIS domain-containing protein [Microbacterium paludicola]|uniref:SIS domain-containing protein n=1 Tax=Microbacterium paludicola TaxID=300019 RepID=A0A4Y9FV61_9MICO|nr:SIS domain-containing protein [Microbacterium paludicola]MBF0817184.1 SIS domain-containing protein [Microbacterium paludicola]TFU32111.1 SIS domain-containing protein [Microbacterium paludicola]
MSQTATTPGESPADRFDERLSGRRSAAALRAKVLAKERENFDAAVELLAADPAVLAAAALLAGARRRYVIGHGKSRSYAAMLSSDLTAGMANVHQIDNASLHSLDVLADVRDTDVLVCFSFHRYRHTSVVVAQEFAAAGGNLVVITDALTSPLIPLTDTVIVVGTESASYVNSPTAVTLLCHLLATLSVSSAKGAKRRIGRREDVAKQLGLYWDEAE